VADIPDGVVLNRDLDLEMRQQQIGSLDQVEWATLESNGSISFIKKS
jgi:uncharacterized membrane protein YcaP (DUF421 family)